jgi:hypothetical protein
LLHSDCAILRQFSASKAVSDKPLEKDTTCSRWKSIFETKGKKYQMLQTALNHAVTG